MSMDIRKLVYLTTFTGMLHDASFSTPTSLDKIGVPKDKNLKYLGELVLSVVVDTPLLDMMTPDYALFTLEKPTYVDSALKKQLLHEIYLRLCAGEKWTETFVIDMMLGQLCIVMDGQITVTPLTRLYVRMPPRKGHQLKR